METLDPECKKTKIKNINQGTYFKLKPTTTAPVWVRGEYERSLGNILALNSMIPTMRNS